MAALRARATLKGDQGNGERRGKPYAQAVLATTAKERGTLDRWQADLAILNEVMAILAQNLFEKSKCPDRTDKQRSSTTCSPTRNPKRGIWLQMLIQRQRINIVSDLVRQYNESVLAGRGIAIADVTTAELPGPNEQEIVRDKLNQFLARKSSCACTPIRRSSAGSSLVLGDQLIDGSVISQLGLGACLPARPSTATHAVRSQHTRTPIGRTGREKTVATWSYAQPKSATS